MTDKNKAMMAYLQDCPALADLFFQFGDGKNGSTGFSATSNDYVNKEYIDGSCSRWYDFTLIKFAPANTYPNDPVNVKSLFDMESVTNWIEEQSEAQNYPDFGEKCDVGNIYVVPNSTTVAGRDYTGMKIMMTCRVEYEERK